VIVAKQDRLGHLIAWHMCRLGGTHGGVGMWMLDYIVSNATALQVFLKRRCNTHC